MNYDLTQHHPNFHIPEALISCSVEIFAASFFSQQPVLRWLCVYDFVLLCKGSPYLYINWACHEILIFTN